MRWDYFRTHLHYSAYCTRSDLYFRYSCTVFALLSSASAAATPGAVERICGEYACELERGVYDPLLVSLLFVFDFVSIHPFNDGNGRMSRLRTFAACLSAYRCGYTVSKYVSIETEIEKTKVGYSEALRASSIGWRGQRLSAVRDLYAGCDGLVLLYP